MSEIFISYAREDRTRAGVLARALADLGWSVWWDRSIPAGKTFDEVIEKALDAAKCIIVLWSKQSVESRWVRSEATEGESRGILIPVLIEPDIRVPLAFRRIQAADLVGWDGSDALPGFQSLVSDVAQLLGPPPKVKAERRRQADAEMSRMAEAERRAQMEAEDRRRKADEERKRLAMEAQATEEIRTEEPQQREEIEFRPRPKPDRERPPIISAEPTTEEYDETIEPTQPAWLKPALWLGGGATIVAALLLSGRRDSSDSTSASADSAIMAADTFLQSSTMPPLPTARLTADDSIIDRGQPVTLSWTTSNATEIRVEPELGSVPEQGSRQVSPTEDATYRLVANGPRASAEDTVRILVRAPSPPRSSETRTGKLQGTVRDQDGKPVGLARVQLCKGGRQLRETGASEDGSYTFNRLPGGEYDVLPGFIGYLGTPVMDVQVAAGQTATADLRMEATAIYVEQPYRCDAGP